ncbi:hypothetical protein H6790_02175 [Candidatus Nomurabacteria bacterium]|nr:hypothetical protein [Candidatus Nomurabacteria bacterium]
MKNKLFFTLMLMLVGVFFLNGCDKSLVPPFPATVYEYHEDGDYFTGVWGEEKWRFRGADKWIHEDLKRLLTSETAPEEVDVLCTLHKDPYGHLRHLSVESIE